MWDLGPWLGIERGPVELGAQSLSHWTTREVPSPSFFKVPAHFWVFAEHKPLKSTFPSFHHLCSSAVTFLSLECAEEFLATIGMSSWKWLGMLQHAFHSPLLFLLTEKMAQLEELLRSKERKSILKIAELLDRVFWGCYMRVKWTSVFFFQPPSSAVTFFQKLNLYFTAYGVRRWIRNWDTCFLPSALDTDKQCIIEPPLMLWFHLLQEKDVKLYLSAPRDTW